MLNSMDGMQPPHWKLHTSNCWKHRLLREVIFSFRLLYVFSISYAAFQATIPDHCL